MFLDFKLAEEEYKKRKDKVLGRHLFRTGHYLVYQPREDVFHVVTYRRTGGYNSDNKWIENPKTEWPSTVHAVIHRTHVDIPRSTFSPSTFQKIFGLSVRKARSIKTDGLDWTFGLRSFHGLPPVKLYSDGRMELQPARQRVFNKDKQKELNAKIRMVRNLLRPRAKLGALDGFSIKEKMEIYLKALDISPKDMSRLKRRVAELTTHNWKEKSILLDLVRRPLTSELVYQLLLRVREDDLRTFLPLVLHAQARHRIYGFGGPNDGKDPLKSFEYLIAAHREGLRRLTNAVEYV